MWRDVSPLYPVDAEGSAGPTSPTVSAPLGADPSLTGAPLVTVAPPTVASTPSTCAAYRCDEPVSSRLTGQCEAHSERWLEDLRHYTDSIGRGELP